MRKKIYYLVEGKQRTSIGVIYQIVMFLAILLCLTPLMFREQRPLFVHFQILSCAMFIFDYLARWITADMRTEQKGFMAFMLYPFSWRAIIDLLTILPTFNAVHRGFAILRIIHLTEVSRLLRLFRVSNHISIIINIIKKEASILSNVMYLCIIYIFITALIMFNFEPEIANFLDALYWATTALTTVGYGDIYPRSDMGKIISMVSSLFGIAIIALPSGIITARYLDELNHRQNKK